MNRVFFVRFAAIASVVTMGACGSDSKPRPEPELDCTVDDTCACEEASVDPNGRVCLDGEYHECTELAPSHCDLCGCSAELPYCDPTTHQCVALKAQGEACETNEVCGSRKCGKPFDGSEGKVCRAQLGETCSDASCRDCVSDGKNSYCSSDCSNDEPAVEDGFDRKFYCITNRDTNASVYHGACAEDGSCPLSNEECTAAQAPLGGTVYYCNPVEDTSTKIDLPFAPSNLGEVQGTELGFIKDLSLCGTCTCSRITFNTDDGSSEMDCVNGLDLPFLSVEQDGVTGPAASLGVFVARTVLIGEGTDIRVEGNRPLVIVAQNRIELDSELSAGGGYPSGADNDATQGPGRGLAMPGKFEYGAGEGASYCTQGALGGGVSTAETTTYGSDTLSPLLGGSAGATLSFYGEEYGAGGGVVQLVAGRSIRIGASGIISVRGHDGGDGSHNGAITGNGGGSGGAILLEAGEVTVDGQLEASGGSGGISEFAGRGASGQTGAVEGTFDENEQYGGGGGGFGRIRINTTSGKATVGKQAKLSPSQSECLSQGPLN